MFGFTLGRFGYTDPILGLVSISKEKLLQEFLVERQQLGNPLTKK